MNIANIIEQKGVKLGLMVTSRTVRITSRIVLHVPLTSMFKVTFGLSVHFSKFVVTIKHLTVERNRLKLGSGPLPNLGRVHIRDSIWVIRFTSLISRNILPTYKYHLPLLSSRAQRSLELFFYFRRPCFENSTAKCSNIWAS